MGGQESEEELWCDSVNAAQTAVSTIASTASSDCSQLEPDLTHQSSTKSSTTDLEAGGQMQHQRDRLFEATAKAANVLLTLESVEQAIDTALNVLGEGIGCDIIAILENVFESSSPLPTYCHFIYEWTSPSFQSLATHVGSESLSAEVLGSAFLEQYFLEGDGFGGLLEVWHEPLRSWLASMQVQAAYTVPIRVNGQWWGVLCFDYCYAPIQIGLAELTVLRTIADCIGSAIQCDRTRKALLETEQNRVTELVRANIAMRQ